MTLDTLSSTPRGTVTVAPAPCLTCKGSGFYDRRNTRGVLLGRRFCRCPVGINREAVALAQRVGNQAMIDDYNRRHWPITADLLANPEHVGYRAPGLRPTELIPLD